MLHCEELNNILYGWFCLLNLFSVMRAITKGSRLGLFTLTKPILARFLAFEPERSIWDLELVVCMGSITEWLRMTPTTGAPNVCSASFTIIFEWQLSMYVTRLRSIYGSNCLVCQCLQHGYCRFGLVWCHNFVCDSILVSSSIWVVLLVASQVNNHSMNELNYLNPA